MKNSLIILLLLIAPHACLLSGCGKEILPKDSCRNEAVWGDFPQIQSFSPLKGANSSATGFWSSVYDSLFLIDKNGNAVKSIVESFSYSDDGMVWNFIIHDDFAFHDGSQLTVDDVLFSLEAFLHSDKQVHYIPKNLVKSYEKTGSNDFSIKMHRPINSLPKFLTFPVLPKKYYDNKELVSSLGLPIGSGPYSVNEITSKKIVMEAFVQPRHKEQNIKRIMVKFFDTEGELWNNLIKGKVHCCQLNNPIYISEATKIPGINKIDSKVRYFNFMFFNCEKYPFNQKVFRQAVHDILNRKEIPAEFSPSCICPFIQPPDFGNALVRYGDNDPKSILSKLKKSNFEIKGDLLHHKGKPVTFTILVVDELRNAMQLALWVKLQLRNIGLHPKIIILNNEDINQKLFSGNYTAVITPFISDDPYSTWHSSSLPENGGLNLCRYKNKNVDILIEDFNGNERVDEFKLQLTKELYSDPPGVFLNWLKRDLFYHESVENVLLNPFDFLSEIRLWERSCNEK